MTLVSSGTLNLKGSAGDPTRSIEYECEGAVSGTFALTTAQGIASSFVGSLPTGMTDFYGYNKCAETIPTVPTGVNASWVSPPSGVVSIFFTKAANADGVDIQRSTNGSTWLPWESGYIGSSPRTTTSSCSYPWYRVRAYNCAGSSSYSSGASAGSC